ncbi:hypothetical protein [Vibrio sp. MA40-2]|uniref:hypothetical protein n=1 Tax=Vibrio sp. MA40-2 TaxID=3391828 RepID=UPI0039A65320
MHNNVTAAQQTLHQEQALNEEQALAMLKANLHLPNGGFHKLILELCIEFQLPFQKIRSVLKKSQRSIEKNIKQSTGPVDPAILTKESWLQQVKQTLTLLAEENKPLMECLVNDVHYIRAISASEQPIMCESEREAILADLAQAYESQVFKSLSAMLYTSDLFWLLSNELIEMTQQRCEVFDQYPQHIEAINHLLSVYDQVSAQPLQNTH